jgi:hypothetical protein
VKRRRPSAQEVRATLRTAPPPVTPDDEFIAALASMASHSTPLGGSMNPIRLPIRAAAAVGSVVLVAGGASYGAFQMVSSNEQPPAVTQTPPATTGTPEATETGTPEATETGTPEATETGTPEATETKTPKAKETKTASVEDTQGENEDSQGQTSHETHTSSPEDSQGNEDLSDD